MLSDPARAEVAFVGILPAAGMGSRLRSLRCPKELLPVAFFVDPLTGVVRPMLAAEHSLCAIREAGVHKCVIVISDRKSEIIRYFGDGLDVGLSIAYVNQPEPLGLALAIDAAHEWVADSCVCLALPDTLFMPRDAVARIKQALLDNDADLVLGVFPTAEPQKLGPVRIGDDGRVVEVLEKPSVTDLYNTWGVAVWSPRFTELLRSQSASLQNLSIGHVFNEAVKRGFNVRAVYFQSGSYTDLGTGASLAAVVVSSQAAENERRQHLFPVLDT